MLHPMIINDNRIMIIKLIIVKLTRSIISETGTETIISLRKEKKRI